MKSVLNSTAAAPAPEVIEAVKVTTLKPKTTTEEDSDYAEPDVDDGNLD